MSDNHAAKLRRAVTAVGKLASQGSESFVVSSEKLGVFACAIAGLKPNELDAFHALVNQSYRQKIDSDRQNLDSDNGVGAE